MPFLGRVRRGPLRRVLLPTSVGACVVRPLPGLGVQATAAPSVLQPAGQLQHGISHVVAAASSAKSFSSFQIYVKTTSGALITVNDMNAEDTVGDLRVKLEDKLSHRVCALLYCGNTLDAAETLAHYHIERGAWHQTSCALSILTACLQTAS